MSEIPFQIFTGVVEDRFDPLEANRVRVRVHGLHTADKNVLPTEKLPWCSVVLPTTSAGVSGVAGTQHFLVEGSFVFLFFRDVMRQEPVVLGTLSSLVAYLPDPESGFFDPNGEYPRKEYLHGPDVNALARGIDIFDSQLVERDFDTNGVKTQGAFGQDIESPDSPFNAKYPHNHVFETESGHVKEYDDTPEHERIREIHKAGTFTETHPDGTRVEKIVRNRYTIVLGDDHVQIEGACHVSIGGDCNLRIEGNTNIQATKNLRLEVEGDMIEHIKGNKNTTVEGQHNVLNKRGFSIRTEGLQEFDTQGNVLHRGSSDFSIQGRRIAIIANNQRFDSTGGTHTISASVLNLPPGTI